MAGGELLEGGSFLRPGNHLRAGNRVARNVQLFVGHFDLPPSPQAGAHVCFLQRPCQQESDSKVLCPSSWVPDQARFLPT